MIQTIIPGKLEGTVQIPPSKSDAQRALLSAALSKEKSILYRIGESDDVQAMLETITRLGAVWQQNEQGVEVTGTPKTDTVLDVHVGESGLGIRLLTAVCAALSDEVRLTGEGSLLQRDLSFFTSFLPAMGVSVELTENGVPITTRGRLKGGDYSVDGPQSSQYVRGLLMALPLCSEDSTLQVHNLKSGAYVAMTIATLSRFGIAIERIGIDKFQIRGGQTYRPCMYTVDADWSAASYWLVAAALGAAVKCSGLSMASLQADKSLMSCLLSAGCRITTGEDGIRVDGSSRHPVEADLTDCPDLFPALTTYGVLTEGVSRLRGVHRLANKESDRGAVLVREFSNLGCRLWIEDDVLVIHGKKGLNGGAVSSHHDHRIAMCLAIAGMFAERAITIEHAEAVGKSYPGFWSDLNDLQSV